MEDTITTIQEEEHHIPPYTSHALTHTLLYTGVYSLTPDS